MTIVGEIDDVEATRRKFLHQKARIQWIKKGDANTKFFHNVIKSKRSKNTINAIYDDEGKLHTKEDEVNAQFLTYYKNLLGSPTYSSANIQDIKSILSKVIDHDWEAFLIAPFTCGEIKETLFSLNPNKSPRARWLHF